MINTAINKQPKHDISTVEEKINLEKQLPFNPDDKKGPTSDLYFHELTKEKSLSQRILQFWGAAFLSISFLVTFPVVAALLKLLGKTVFQKVTVPGRRGIEFEQYQYSAQNGSFLKKSGIYKLPAMINIWKGEMDLVGPKPYPTKWCNAWNNNLSDYYKRFALKPGYVGIQDNISGLDDIDGVARSLEDELKYVQSPSLKKDLNYLFSIR